MRKGLLIAAVAVAALAVAPALWLVLDNSGGDRRVGALGREAASGAWNFEIDGSRAGVVQSLAGCTVHAAVVNETAGPDYYVKKHIAQPQYRECVIEVGASESKSLWQWVSASMQQNYTRKDVALIQGTLRLELRQTLITGLEIPELRANDTNPAYLKLTLAPEFVRKQPSGGQFTPARPEGFTPSTATLELSGIRRVGGLSSVGPWRYDVPAVVDTIGELRDYAREPGKLNFGSLGVRLSETAADSAVPALDAYFDDFVIQGNSGEANEKEATLAVSSPSGAILQLNLANVGIFDAGLAAGNLRSYDFYVERATLG